MEKVCSFCNETKALSEFHKDKHSVEGIQRKCKECAKKYSLIYRNAVNLLRCCRCGNLQPREAFISGRICSNCNISKPYIRLKRLSLDKTCIRCKETKPRSQFVSGRICSSCEISPQERNREAQRKFREKRRLQKPRTQIQKNLLINRAIISRGNKAEHQKHLNFIMERWFRAKMLHEASLASEVSL